MTIREATVLDVDEIAYLIKTFSSKGLMLPKTPYKIFSTIQNFFVAEKDKKIIGCVALNVIWKDLCEVCSLAVSEEHRGKGIGKLLVKKALDRAKKLKIPRAIALTYEDKFFEKMGFHKVDKDQFPRKLWRECLECPKLEECDEIAYLYNL